MPLNPQIKQHIQRRTWLQSALATSIAAIAPVSWKVKQVVMASPSQNGRAWRPFDALLAADRARTPRPVHYPRTEQAWQSELFK